MYMCVHGGVSRATLTPNLEHPPCARRRGVKEGNVLSKYGGEVQASETVGLPAPRPCPEALVQEGCDTGADS